MKPTTTLILSCLLAFIVWLFAIDQENPLNREEYQEPILIAVRGMDDGLQSLQNLTNRTTTLTLRAPQRTLESLHANDFSAVIDLTGLAAGSHEVPVHVTTLNPDVDIIALQPRQLRVQLEPVISKVVPVQVEVMDSPAFGYDWQTPLVEPEKVEVIGPQTQVEQVRSVVAEVFLRNAKSQVERIRPLSPQNAQNLEVERVKVEPVTARIFVPVVQPPGRKEVVVRVQPNGAPAPSYRLTGVKVEPLTIVLVGSPNVLREVPGYVETFPLSIEGATGEVRKRLPLVLPENTLTLEEDSVLVTVGVAPLESSLTVTRQPVVRGVDDTMRFSVSPEQVDVIVGGSLPLLESLGPEDVRVMLDLTGLLPGSHVVQPTVVPPEGIEVEGVLPEAIEVLIESLATPTPTDSPPTPAPTDSAPTDSPPTPTPETTEPLPTATAIPN